MCEMDEAGNLQSNMLLPRRTAFVNFLKAPPKTNTQFPLKFNGFLNSSKNKTKQFIAHWLLTLHGDTSFRFEVTHDDIIQANDIDITYKRSDITHVVCVMTSHVLCCDAM